MPKIKTIIILGPTSSGKSDLAVNLAQKINGEVISVDSRQIYKDMNLGTGKVEGKWQQQNKSSVFIYKNIPHYLLDFQSPRTYFSQTKKYTVIDFRRDCLRLIKKISNKNKIPILCGGTGFWISAVIDNPQFPQVKPNEKLRSQLLKQSTQKLFQQLQKKDLKRTKKIDSKNKYRLIRALEICEEFGTVPPIKNTPPKNIEFLQIGLDWSVEKLAKKIEKRLKSRWTEGMIEEVKKIKKKYQLSWQEIQMFGLAYYWIPLYLQNKLNDNQGNIITNKTKAREELIQRVYYAEKNYAKRQRTWFKKDNKIIWENNPKKILALTKRFFRK